MMRTLLLLLAVGVWCGLSHAQGDPPCTDPFCLSVGDTGCDPAGCTEFPTGVCTFKTFTVPCDATYRLFAIVYCPGAVEPCGDCNSCVWVYPTNDPTNIIARTHTVNCDRGECRKDMGVPLAEGVSYTIAVSLTPCPPHTCNDCRALCTAYGCIWLNNTTGCCPY